MKTKLPLDNTEAKQHFKKFKRPPKEAYKPEAKPKTSLEAALEKVLNIEDEDPALC